MEGLEVQKFLKKNSLKKLSEDYGIKVKEHPHHVGLNYDQIKSPKTHLITRECRSLKLLKNDDWDVAGRSFDRFFNYGEAPDTYVAVFHFSTKNLWFFLGMTLLISLRVSSWKKWMVL